MAIKTIKDPDGRVWTGKSVGSNSPGTDMIFGIATLGLTELAKKGSATVEVNGQRHSGTIIKNQK